MPRPKRTKVTPSKPVQHVGKSPNKRLTGYVSEAPKLPFDDLYDVSDQEDKKLQVSLVTSRSKGKEKSGSVNRVLSNAIAREQKMDKNKNNLRSKKNRLSEIESCSLTSSPTAEMGRREHQTLAKGRPELTMGSLRTVSSPINTNYTEIQNSNNTILNDPIILNFSPGENKTLRRNIKDTNVAQPLSQSPESIIRYENDDSFSFDASTPLNISKAKDTTTSSSTSSDSKKRKLSDLQAPQSSFVALPPTLLETNDIIPATYQDSEENQADIEVEHDAISSIEDDSLTPQDLRDIMAPPHSSSSIQSSPAATSRSIRASSRNLRSRFKTPQIGMESDSNISSPPSLTHSPDLPRLNSIKPKTNKHVISPSSFSTAQLKTLLPRRRRRKVNDIFDNSNSDDEINLSRLGSDEDELGYLAVSVRPQSHNSKPRATETRKKHTNLNQKDSTTSRTYGTRINSHSETDDEITLGGSDSPPPEDLMSNKINQDLEKKNCKELKKAAEKFKEIDMWQLDFEDATGNSSSSKDAR